MATFVMQALGCDVSAIDTVHFSESYFTHCVHCRDDGDDGLRTDCSNTGNHTAYKQFKGRRVPAEEVEELYEGLRQSDLNDFDMLLSGYAASKEVVDMVGKIARDLRYRRSTRPGSFFWGKLPRRMIFV